MPAGLAAQTGRSTAVNVSAGSEFEEYLRVLQITGHAPLHPWSVRAFSPAEIDRLGGGGGNHPWAGRYGFLGERRSVGLEIFAPRAAAVFNSGFPHGSNDGPLWAGRGLTTAVEAGFAVRLGPLSLTVAPVMFHSRNAEFDLAEHVVADEMPFNDWRRPTQIDHPQRPGDEAVTRIDAGQSTLRIDALGLAAGISTANQVWGPAGEYPVVVGNNAPGFLHVFAGTGRPLNVGIGRVHGRIVWGRLEQSEFSPVSPDSASRFMTGLVGVFTPRGGDGLEIGFGRFFHLPWPRDGVGANHVLRPLESVFKVNFVTPDESYLLDSVVSNQLLSVFGRWVLPRSGLELYGEYGTEDHRHNLRDLVLQPDHAVAFLLGVRKAWQRSDHDIVLLRGELLNSDRSHLHRTRRQEPFYVHANTRQGHTHRGQIIGSPAAIGGGGATLAVDRFTPDGRGTIAWSRMLRYKLGEFVETGVVESPDVIHALGAEFVLFRGRWDIQVGSTAVVNLNRNYETDAFNLNGVIGIRTGF